MKKNLLAAIIIFSSTTLLTSCGGNEGKPNAQAKATKGGYGIILDTQSYTQGDLDLLNYIKDGNERRVKSILDEGTADLYSSDGDDVTGLMVAASLKNDSIVKLLLEKTKDGDDKILNRADKTGKTPIIYAADTGSPENITLLRKKGANPNVYDSQKNFPLLLAAKNNNLDSVKALLEDLGDMVPANPDLQNGDGESAILAATKNNNKDMMQTLKNYGANLNASTNEGTTPLIYAVDAKNKVLFDFILSLGADINNLGDSEKTPLLYAIEHKNYDFTKYILDKGADPNTHAKGLASPLQELVSIEGTDAALVDYMLVKGAKLNDPDMPLGNVLGRAVHKGNAPAIAKLFARGAKASDVETPSTSGVIMALKADDPDIAVTMIDNGANIAKMDEEGYSALALAAKKNYKNVFEDLVKKGADVNQTSRNKSAIPIEIVLDNDRADLLEIMFNNGLKASPDAILLHAVSAKEDNIIPVALKHGSRPNIMNSSGQPILWLAIAKDDNSAAKALIEAGALLDVQDSSKGLSPLSLAVARGNAEISQYLIEKNANPDLVDINGFSALAYAAASGQTDIVNLLIAHKAEVNAVDKSGNTILQLVELSKITKEKKDEIKKILTQAGAQ